MIRTHRSTPSDNSRSNHSRLAIATLTLCIITLGVINVWLSARVSHLGIHLKEVEMTRIELTKTNVHIENKLLEETALSDLQEKASQRGFVQKAEVVRLTTTPPLALR